MDTNSSAPSAAPTTEPYQLGKHMAKLHVQDTGVVLLRPRYEMKASAMKAAIMSINAWQKATGTKLQVLIVPHDYDVFAFEADPWTAQDTIEQESHLASALASTLETASSSELTRELSS